jgi:hypothetical protein
MKSSFKAKPRVVLAASFVCYTIVVPESAWALQTHGTPEGLYVHQMAHVYFFLALVYLYWDVRRSSFSGKGWRYLLRFCLCMLCWNTVAFIGHALAGHVDAQVVSGAGGYLRGSIKGADTVKTLLFYLAKFDHVFVVPALYFLYKGMHSLFHSVGQQRQEKQ